MASLICVVLYLLMHACSGRLLRAAVNSETATQTQPTGWVPTKGSWLAEHSDSTVDGVRDMQLDNRKVIAVEEVQHIEGNQMNTPDIWMSLQIGAGRKVQTWSREGRSTLESVAATENTEETMKSMDDDTLKDDVQVMDYAQAHRKPPIHNKGT